MCSCAPHTGQLLRAALSQNARCSPAFRKVSDRTMNSYFSTSGSIEVNHTQSTEPFQLVTESPKEMRNVKT